MELLLPIGSLDNFYEMRFIVIVIDLPFSGFGAPCSSLSCVYPTHRAVLYISERLPIAVPYLKITLTVCIHSRPGRAGSGEGDGSRHDMIDRRLVVADSERISR